MADYLEEIPLTRAITTYDKAHMVEYLRVHDAAEDGADWEEAVMIIFGIDPEEEPNRARLVHDAHLARARWFVKEGWAHLLRQARMN